MSTPTPVPELTDEAASDIARILHAVHQRRAARLAAEAEAAAANAGDPDA